jgi:release factor glutamine methyltransferase
MVEPPEAGATTLANLLRQARTRLSASGAIDAQLDGRTIVEHLTSTTRLDAISRPDTPVDADTAAKVMRAIERRATGEPVHRILGAREFYGLRLALSPDTLEPRPDTEALVELALPHAQATASATGRCRILDLGTGTGAIALALLSAVPEARAVLTDVSAGALATAAANARALGLASRAETLQSDWFAAVTGLFDLIVSNPPYIPTAEIAGLEPDVRDHDPRRALDGGTDGLDPYRIIASGASAHLAPGGHIAVEIGAGQKADVADLFDVAGFALAASRHDLGGHERALLFARNGRGGHG